VKEKKYKDSRTLRANGNFERSLTVRGDRNAYLKITDKQIEIDSLCKTKGGKYKLISLFRSGWHKPEIRPVKAKVLSFQGPNGRIFTMKSRAVDVKARNPVEITKKQRDRWMKFFQIDMQDKIKIAGRM